MRKPTIIDEYMNQVIWVGSLPIRRGNYIFVLDEIAKTYDSKNWMRIRDAGLIGNTQFNEKHGYPSPDTQPITLEEFKKITKYE